MRQTNANNIVSFKERVTRCPHGQGYGQKQDVPISTCIIDRNTPGTLCHTMSCNHIDTLQEKRPFDVCVRRLVPGQHKPQPVFLYAVSDITGVSIVNAYTGERKLLDITNPSVPKAYKELHLIERRSRRKTKDGALLSYPYTGWIGGGVSLEQRLYCDCVLCQNMRPHYKAQNALALADEYARSLPEDLRQYWHKYVWQYVLRNGSPSPVPLSRELRAGKRHIKYLLRVETSKKRKKYLHREYKDYKILTRLLRRGLI